MRSVQAGIHPVFSRSTTFIAFILLAGGVLAAAEFPRQIKVNWAPFQSVDGEALGKSTGDWTVVCFLGTECPLTRLYGERLNVLVTEFKGKGVRFIGVNSNPQDSPADMIRHMASSSANVVSQQTNERR